MRDEYADRFADCVVNRSEKDLIMRLPLTLVTILIMPFVSGSIVYYLCENYISEGYLQESSLEIALFVFLTVFCSLVSFTMCSMISRSRSHLDRDLEWMDSLIGYASNKGCNVDVLRQKRNNAKGIGLAITQSVSYIFWGLTLLLLLMSLFLFTSESLSGFAWLGLLAVYAVVLIQFVFTLGPAIRFPGNNESLQSDFTMVLRDLLASKGIHIEPMLRSVPNSHRILWLIATVVTLGLFHIVLVFYSMAALNRHMYNQWMYEENLLNTIVKAEGATGIECYADKTKRKSK